MDPTARYGGAGDPSPMTACWGGPALVRLLTSVSTALSPGPRVAVASLSEHSGDLPGRLRPNGLFAAGTGSLYEREEGIFLNDQGMI